MFRHRAHQKARHPGLRTSVDRQTARHYLLDVDPLGDDPWEVERGERIVLENEPEFVECLHAGKKVVEVRGTRVRIVHPIRNRSSTTGFIAIEAPKDDSHDSDSPIINGRNNVRTFEDLAVGGKLKVITIDSDVQLF